MTLVFLPSDGFGNLLFQHNAAYAFARERNLELYALGWYYDARPKFAEYHKLFKHVKILGNISDCYPSQEFFQDPQSWRINKAFTYFQGKVHLEPGHAYSPIPNDTRIMSGYFQSWKYFDKFRIEIRDLLRSNEIETWEAQKSRFSGGICVHFRWGGDSLTNFSVQQPVLTKEYYIEAMKLFPDSKCLFFCEDPELVRDFAGPNVEIIEEPDPMKTLFLMSICEHFIIANSTLSLMAYYMRENEKARIVAPKNWFKHKPDYDINDVVKNATFL